MLISVRLTNLLSSYRIFQQKKKAEVTVVTVGDLGCEPTLRKCLAIGADKAIRIDLNPTDGFQVAQQLSTHCKKENYDLISGELEL